MFLTRPLIQAPHAQRLQHQPTQHLQPRPEQGRWALPPASSVNDPTAAQPDARRPAHGNQGGARPPRPQAQPAQSPFVNSANMRNGTAIQFNDVMNRMNFFLIRNGNQPVPARQVVVPPPAPVRPTAGPLPPLATRLGTVAPEPRRHRPAAPAAEPVVTPQRTVAATPRGHHGHHRGPTLAVANDVHGRVANVDIHARSLHIRGLPGSSRQP